MADPRLITESDPERRPATGHEDPFTQEGLVSALKGLYGLVFGGDTESNLATGMMGLMGNVHIPQSSRAFDILKKKVPALENYPQLSLQRRQVEGPGETEPLFRGGQYYLGNRPGDRPDYMSYNTGVSNTEGGPNLKVSQAMVDNPLVTQGPHDSARLISKFIGEKEWKNLSSKMPGAPIEWSSSYPGEYTEISKKQGLANLSTEALKAGAHPRQVDLAMSAKDPTEALLDLYKTQWLKRSGYDAVVRTRGSARSSEVFLVDPRRQIFKNEFVAGPRMKNTGKPQSIDIEFTNVYDKPEAQPKQSFTEEPSWLADMKNALTIP